MAPDVLQPSAEERALCLAVVASLRDVLEMLRAHADSQRPLGAIAR
jgi:hypothetical protein